MRAISIDDARRTWNLNGGEDSGPSPFDPMSLSDLRKRLDERGW
jgi:hypothetical protein